MSSARRTAFAPATPAPSGSSRSSPPKRSNRVEYGPARGARFGGRRSGSRARPASFAELRELRERLPGTVRRRVGFCADTCHLFAAGYDLRDAWEEVWETWDRTLGLEHLHCLHLNDSQTPRGSRRDRHALIAEGTLGPESFRRIMRDPRFRHVITVLETPRGDDPVRTDRRMRRRLRAHAGGPRPD